MAFVVEIFVALLALMTVAVKSLPILACGAPSYSIEQTPAQIQPQSQPQPQLQQDTQTQTQTSTTTSSCQYTFGLTPPAGFTDSMMIQWCAMVENNVNGLVSKEAPSIMVPTIKALYAQAYPSIAASPDSALPNVDQIMQDPMARAALQKTMDNYPAFGSMDNTPEDIQEVYADAITAASSLTGVPADMLRDIIWTESKGFPLVYQGLTQMDYVAWGQMADKNPELKNRYMPRDNIISAAMYLAEKHDQFGGTWEECYKNHYQDPNAASYAAAA